MNARTLTALNKSIKHWEDIEEKVKDNLGKKYIQNYEDGKTRIDGKEVFEIGARSCALCCLFVTSDCGECPVKLRSKHMGCDKTPFVIFDNLLQKHKTFTQRMLKAAYAEVVFLRSLRPRA